ncbi:MAG TPA: hypothetical protein VFD92_05720 [Candidatus Binatia bacterium]|nr:hypothetical protein [Candidatus Binatia bacterium]
MFFLHCRDCETTVRSIANATSSASELAADPMIREFHESHAGCRTTCYFPTGRAESSLAWHEPLAERRIEVRGSDGHAVAIGSRATLDEPILWRLERADVDEEISVELDRDAFFRVLDRALHPHHVPVRTISAWATQIEDYVQRIPREELVLLQDDPARPNVSHACLTLTSRTALERLLARQGLDDESARRLFSTFEDPEFPPLAVTRRLVAMPALASAR